jgi:hypothetical protein
MADRRLSFFRPITWQTLCPVSVHLLSLYLPAFLILTEAPPILATILAVEEKREA